MRRLARRRGARRSALRRTLLAAAVAVAVATAVSAVALATTGDSTQATSSAAPASTVFESPPGGLSFQPVLGLPASDVQVIGASPGEAAGEVWAQGTVGDVPAIVSGQAISNAQELLRYTSASGAWQVVPVEGSEGQPLSFDWWGSEVTAAGGVVLAGEGPGVQTGSSADVQSVVTRDPGGAFVQAPSPSSSGAQAVIAAGEELFPTSSSSGRASVDPLVAALDEADGQTGALVVPVWSSEPHGETTTSTSTSTSSTTTASTTQTAGEPAEEPAGVDEPGVLDYDGSAWTREPICKQYTAGECTPEEATLKPLALAASSPEDAYLLGSSAGHLLLFQRVRPTGASTPVWVPVAFSSGLLATNGAPAGETLSAPSGGAILTVTSQGVWVDLKLSAATSSGSATLLASAAAADAAAPEGEDPGTVLGTWCYPTSLCAAGTPSLGAELPSDYASFAWPGTGGDPGTRIITGLEDGALLRLSEGQGEFSYVVGGGAGGGGAIGAGGVTLGLLPGSGGSAPSGGAAFDSPGEGWLGGSEPLLHVTTSPSADQLSSWPVPFRRPLLAIASQPGATPGASGAQALAVGAEGEVARYVPEQGWSGEYLYNAAGERQTPDLTGVAWPEPERAYAVGDNGAMWLWQASTGLWEPDPAAPVGFKGQLMAIAFSPNHPEVGYAVGKQGVLLSYGKTWTQEALPAGLSDANFTSVAFAGEEAIATYRMPAPTEKNPYLDVGGLIVDECPACEPGTPRSGWHAEPQAAGLLAQLPGQDTILSKVAGLPDGGAVAAGPGVVIERNPGSGEWHFSSQPLPEAGDVVALAAIQEGTSVRALASISVGASTEYGLIDNPPGPALGQYGELLGPDPLPSTGYLLRETPAGWQDEEGDAYPMPTQEDSDLPGWPDPVLALAVEPSGAAGWAVGGQTGEGYYQLATGQSEIETAGVMYYGSGPAPPQSTSVPVSAPAGQASFALGGDAQCESRCADFANERLGADAWLSAAIAHAGQIAGLHAFLYAGQHVAGLSSHLSAGAFSRELADYAELLGGGSLPVYAASSPSDVPAGGSVSGFSSALGSHAPASSVPAGTPAPLAGSAAYAFESPGAGGTVRVIVLDFSASTLGASQLTWLAEQLQSAKAGKVPAIVLGSANVSEPRASNYAQDAAEVDQALLTGGASAYLFDSPEENVQQTIGTSAESIPAYGSGTLGYTRYALNGSQDNLGASGFLLLSVDVAQRSAQTNRAPVTVSLIPSIGQLSLEASNGTLLHRSQVALFDGLARRPEGGEAITYNADGSPEGEYPELYVPIPESCLGSNCSQFIAPSYSFSSSDPEVGDFVEQNPDSTNARAVLQVDGKPVADPASGLFCAYNAGATTVTISAGGLSYSETVTVQAGSVEQPCGTVPLANPPAARTAQSSSNPIVPAPPVEPEPEPEPELESGLSLTPPAPPAPPAPKPHKAAHRTPPRLVAPPLATSAVVPLRAALPAPAPQPARPTPPSGTSQVTEPVGAAQREREQQGAVDVVHNMAAYQPGGDTLPPYAPLALIVIAAAAGAGVRRSRRDRRRVPAWASARSEPPPRRR